MKLWSILPMKLSLLLIALIGIVSCATSKVVPVPDAKMVAKSGIEIEQLQRGHKIFTTQCTRCHEQRFPDQISDRDWHAVLPAMAWNAGLSKADEDAVKKYIKAAR